MAFIKFISKCPNEPKYLLKIIAILICLCIATYQLSGCFTKILHPPTSTHSSFKLNQTMKYPSLTICRNPGFKSEKFAKYGLTEAPQPSYTSFWKQFDFENFTLDEFFEETTYTLKEVIPLHGFDGDLNSLDIQEFTKLSYGKCFKLTPKSSSARWEKMAGYSLYMVAHPPINDSSNKIHQEASKYGFHVFVHEPSEKISDDGDQSDSFMEYIFVETQNDLRYSLTASEYRNLPSKDNGCRGDPNYSKSMCQELCLTDVVTREVGCSAPWLENTLLPRCSTYMQIKCLIKTFNEYSKRNNNKCNCPHSCNITIYMPMINEGKTMDYKYQSAFSLYYLSNLVTVTEEIAVYDWSLFISDLGGSLGFLLGLSVLGFISLMEQIFKMCLALQRKSEKKPPPIITEELSKQNKTYLIINDQYI